MQHVKVVPLLYGSSWNGKSTAYLQGFLQTLFADGRYLANLAQYSHGSYQIGNGSAVDPVVDATVLPRVGSALAATGIHYQVTDDQIQAEIKAQFSAGKLPPPDADTLYVVVVQYDTVVIADSLNLGNSEANFLGYHYYSSDGGYAYAVVSPTGDDPSQVATAPTGYHGALFDRDMVAGLSHELAEAVTDSQGDGWYDDNYSGDEIADIPIDLYNLGFLTDDQLFEILTGSDGTQYVVQTVWSNSGKTLTALIPVPAP